MSAATAGSRPSTDVGAPLRLTVRGRAVVRAGAWLAVTTIAALVVLLGWLVVASAVAPGASAGDGTAGVSTGTGAVSVQEVVDVVVLPGDSLWGIAREHSPTKDPRSVVAAVVELNDLSGTGVQAGQVLRVPVG